MRVQTWMPILAQPLSFRALTTTLAALVIGTMALAEGPDEMVAPDTVHDRATPSANFTTKRFDGVAVAAALPWETSILPEPGALNYMVLGFSGVAANPGSYRVEVLDSSSRLLARYEAPFLADNASFTTPMLPPQSVRIRVVGPVGAGDLRFAVDRMLVARQATLSQSLIPNLTVHGQMSSNERLRGSGLAKLIINDVEVCSAFLVSADTLVTNQHCLRRSSSYANSPAGAKRCADIAITFDYVSNPYIGTGNPKCVAVLKAVPAPVDVAVLKLDRPPSNAAVRIFGLAQSDPSEEGQVTHIYEHPWGFPLGLVKGCTVRGTLAGSRKLEHDCNTLGGASGSPLLNSAGEVIGIHSNGYIGDGATQVQVMEAWYAACNTGKCPTNLGTRVSKIREALQ